MSSDLRTLGYELFVPLRDLRQRVAGVGYQELHILLRQADLHRHRGSFVDQ